VISTVLWDLINLVILIKVFRWTGQKLAINGRSRNPMDTLDWWSIRHINVDGRLRVRLRGRKWSGRRWRSIQHGNIVYRWRLDRSRFGFEGLGCLRFLNVESHGIWQWLDARFD